MRAGSAAGRAVLGGTAVVCCIHDREKRKVVTEAHVRDIGLSVGILYDPKVHKLQNCACCENLFFDIDDEPRYCSVCKLPPVHALAGPLAQPEGVIS